MLEANYAEIAQRRLNYIYQAKAELNQECY